MTMAFLYARFSPRPDAEENDSAEKQLKRCKEYSEGTGYQVFGDGPSDKRISGGVLNRPNLNIAIEDLRGFVKRGSNCVLVVDSPDRLARDVLVYLTIRQHIADAGGRIEYADGSPPDGTPEGELMLNILAAFAQYERSRIRYRTKRGLKRRQKNGEWFGKPPIGYMLDPENSKKLIDCPEERSAIARARTSKKLGWNSERITEDLQKVFGNFRGKPWSARTVRKMIKKTHRWEQEQPSVESDEES